MALKIQHAILKFWNNLTVFSCCKHWFQNLTLFPWYQFWVNWNQPALSNLFPLATLYFACLLAECGRKEVARITCEAYARRLQAEVHWSSENGWACSWFGQKRWCHPTGKSDKQDWRPAPASALQASKTTQFNSWEAAAQVAQLLNIWCSASTPQMRC